MGIVNALLVRYEGGFTFYNDGASITAHGVHEGFVSLGGVADLDEVERTCDAYFAALGDEQTATKALIEPFDVSEEPYSGFVKGETVLCPDELGVEVAQEVAGITVTEDGEGNPIFVPELNDRIVSADELLRDWQTRMSVGTLGGFSQSATPATPAGSQSWGEQVSLSSASLGDGSSSQSPVGARVTRAAVQTIPNNADTSITFDTEEYDTHGFWESTAPTVFTVPVSGYYVVSGHVKYAANATGWRLVFIERVADGKLFTEERNFPNASKECEASCATVAYLGAGDQVRLRTSQTSGGDLATSGFAAHFAIQLIAPVETDTPGAKIYSTANQAIPTGTTNTAIAFDASSFDTAGMADLANDRIVIPSAGIYVVGGWIQWASNATGRRRVTVAVNGTGVASQTAVASASDGHQSSATGIVVCAAGDLITLFGSQDSGGNLNSETLTSNRPSLWAVKLQALDSTADVESARIRRAAGSQNLASGTSATALTFDTEGHDTAAFYASVADTFMTVPVTGVYAVSASVVFPSDATGARHLEIFESAGSSAIGTTVPAVSGVAHSLSVAHTFRFAAGTQISARAWQNSGSTLAVTAAALSMQLLRRG